MQRFSHEAIGNYSVFQVDAPSRTLYVGARDALLALPLEAIGQQARKVSLVRRPRRRTCPHLTACGWGMQCPMCGLDRLLGRGGWQGAGFLRGGFAKGFLQPLPSLCFPSQTGGGGT